MHYSTLWALCVHIGTLLATTPDPPKNRKAPKWRAAYYCLLIAYCYFVCSSCMYAAVVCMQQLYVCSSCMYAAVLCMQQFYVCSSSMYAAVVCMQQFYVCSSCMYAAVVCMQQLYVCSSRYHYHYCRFIATSALLHLAALHFGAFRII